MLSLRRTVASSLLAAAVASCGGGADVGDLHRTLELLGGPLPEGRIGYRYEATLRAVGADPEGLRWTTLSGRPPGLSLTPVQDGQGLLEGVPSEAGAFSLKVLVTAIDGQVTEATLPLMIVHASRLEVVDTALPLGRVGEVYEGRVEARGGTGVGHLWRLAEGALPDGLEVVQQGEHARVFGVPEVEGSAAFVIEVRDSAGTRAARTMQVTVEPALSGLTIRPPEPPGDVVDMPIILQIEALEGRAPMQWRLSGPEIPGLAFEAGPSRIAHITGTPTEVGRYPVRLSVVDADGLEAIATLTLLVAAPLMIDDAPLGAGTVGDAYEASVVATEAGGEHAWAIVQDSLPPGLGLMGDGNVARLTGTPTSTGTFSFTLEAMDRLGQRTQRTATILVTAPLRLQVTLPTSVRLGEALDVALRAEGGRAPFTFEITAGTLPAGPRLEANEARDARLVGPAGELGRFPFTLSVVDRDQRRAQAALVLEVLPSQVPLSITPPLGSLSACRGGALRLETLGGSRFAQVWTVQSGLPPGLRLVPTATTAAWLGGVPRTAGSYSVTVQVQDSSGQQATATVPVNVEASDAARWAVIDRATDAQGRPAVLLGDLCADVPEITRVYAGDDVPLVVMSPDGRWLAIQRMLTTTQSELRLLDLRADPLQEYTFTTSVDFLAWTPVFDPSGATLTFVAARIVAGDLQSQIQRIDLNAGTPSAPITVVTGAPDEDLRVRAVGPNGRWLAFKASRHELRVLDRAGGPPTTLPGDADPIGFDANGDWLLYTEQHARGQLARAWRLGAAGPAIEFGPPLVPHWVQLVSGGQAALLYFDVVPHLPWLRYTFTSEALLEQGAISGTELCGEPVPLGDRWVRCPSTVGPTLVDLTGGLGVITIGPPSQGPLRFSPGAEWLVMQTELDPGRGVETVAYDLGAMPNPSPRALAPSPPAGGVATIDFARGGARILLTGQNGYPTTVHDLTRWPARTELWRGQADLVASGPAWRNDGTGVFVDVGGQARWLDLSIPEAPRIVSPVAPPGVRLDSSLIRVVLVPPDP